MTDKREFGKWTVRYVQNCESFVAIPQNLYDRQFKFRLGKFAMNYVENFAFLSVVLCGNIYSVTICKGMKTVKAT